MQAGKTNHLNLMINSEYNLIFFSNFIFWDVKFIRFKVWDCQ